MVGSTVAVVIGAGGGIGAALVAELAASHAFDTIHALSRVPGQGDDRTRTGVIDITSEDSIAAAAAAIGAPVDLVIVATGMLHEAGRMPEKALRSLDAGALGRMFEVNTIGPALVLKHFAPLLARDRRSVMGMLSARVGSISDNRSGGWYGYRAAKAALNMMVKCAGIEIARTRPQAICVALHPGTVDTALSLPFQGNVAAGTLFTPAFSAQRLLAVMGRLGPEHTGRIFAWDGEEIAP